jgi:hypothetical protein
MSSIKYMSSGTTSALVTSAAHASPIVSLPAAPASDSVFKVGASPLVPPVTGTLSGAPPSSELGSPPFASAPPACEPPLALDRRGGGSLSEELTAQSTKAKPASKLAPAATLRRPGKDIASSVGTARDPSG